MNRRSFLTTSTMALAAAPAVVRAADKPSAKRRVAIIGHTGRGNYGHGLDTVWEHIAEAEIVAVADADEAGLAKELQKLKVDRGFTDYHQMLKAVKPEFVSVAPRHPDQHRDMILAAIQSGARGIYVEKPFCRTPAEADALVAACKSHNVRLAVAHRNRYHPVLPIIEKMITEREIGRLLEIRGRGKGDRRGGDEDLWVLGSHVLNLCTVFAGEPVSCSALMLRDGKRVTREHVKDGAEGLGPLAANEVHARYEMSSGVPVFFDSIANDDTASQGFGLQIVGSKGIVQLQVDRDPVAHLIPGNPFQPSDKPRPWVPITSTGVGMPETNKALIAKVHNHVAAVEDLIEAVDSGREPLCGVLAAATTVEMICAVFESHRQGGGVVALPLPERGHALTRL